VNLRLFQHHSWLTPDKSRNRKLANYSTPVVKLATQTEILKVTAERSGQWTSRGLESTFALARVISDGGE
jgi:hypothetical protein